MSDILQRARFRLDHRWAPARMSDYLDTELSSGRRQRLERHLAECEECRRMLAGLRALLGALHGLPAAGSGAVDGERIAASVRLRLGEERGSR
jgi:anti-sigma factor RsiW